MTKKTLVSLVAIIVLSICCGFSFAADNDNSVNLGDEVTQSIDKAGNSMENAANAVFSGEMMDRAVNTVTDGMNDAKDIVTDGMDNSRDNMSNRDGRVNDGIVNSDRMDQRNYNATRTTTEGTIADNNMSTTTWMWIILSVAAIMIIAAIWFYATQNND